MIPNKQQFPIPDSEQHSAHMADVARADTANEAMANDPKLNLKAFGHKVDENSREIETRRSAREDTVADLQSAAKRGYPKEISGDALARVKGDRGPKIIKE